MKRIIFALFFFILLVSVLFLASCQEEPEGPEITVSLSRVNLEMSVGDVYTLKAEVSPKDYAGGMRWESSNPAVATCEGGVVVAHSAGKCNVSVTLDGGEYFVCSVSVNEKIEKYMYMTVGMTSELDLGAAPVMEGGTFSCVDSALASVARDGERVYVTAASGGSTHIVLSDGVSIVTVCELFVLDEAGGYNVSLDLPDTPLYVPCVKNIYETGVTVSAIDVSYDASEELLSDGLVRVKLVFHFKKTYDSDGDGATNATGFTFEIYSGEKDGILRSHDVLESGVSVESDEPLTYEYQFDAVLNDGGGRRSFTFVIVDAEKENKE